MNARAHNLAIPDEPQGVIAKIMSPLTMSVPVASERTRATVRMILGGRTASAYWGFDLESFLRRFNACLMQEIGDPEKRRGPVTADQERQAALLLQENDAAGRVQLPVYHADGSVELLGLDGMDAPADQAIRTAGAIRYVGLNGPIGCGKDTVADAIVERFGYQKMSFADPLRLAGSFLFRVPLEHFLDRDLKEQHIDSLGMSPRRLLQILGTEVGRSTYSQVWVERLQLRAASYSGATPTGVVIADVRFHNEADFLRKEPFGTIARISRPAVGAAAAAKSNGHASEAGISKASSDVSLVNEGSLHDYIEKSIVSLGLEPLHTAPARRRGFWL